jgi:ribosomal protein S6--L-glutamate ligase
MRILVLAEKENIAKPFVNAMKEKGIKANYLQLLKINLVSKHKNIQIKALNENIPKYDAVFLQARTDLAPFIEPLIDILKEQKIYCNAKPGSYYISVNEPYRFVNLSANNIKTPKTLSTGSIKNIQRVSKKISYPLIAKSFIGKNVQQSMIVKTDDELNNFVKSIKTRVDGFMLREFIDDCVVSSVVVGEKVFAIDRRQNNKCVLDLEKGRSYTLTDDEKELVINASRACGLEIARVDFIKGRVISVEPEIPLETFNKICSENVEKHVANFFIDKINLVGAKRTVGDDVVELVNKFSKTVFSRFLK